MCKCIESLSKQGYVVSNSAKWDAEKRDFIDIPIRYFIKKIIYHANKYDTVSPTKIFLVNFCPACGEKIDK